MSWEILDDIETFLTDLVLGDFKEEQSVSVQVVSGVIQLVPILGQVMAVRDVAGSFFQVNRKGGFEQAGLNEKINLSFSVIGAIPEVGDVFKTVFKPLWKERKLAKTLVNTGVEMLERMRGLGKGGAVRWIRTLDWAGKTSHAIDIANQVLADCIQMLNTLAAGAWWIPDQLQDLARELSPKLGRLQGKLNDPIREGVQHIKDFLAGMLGEDAAAVAFALAEHAAINTRAGSSGSGHKPGAATASGKAPHEERHPAAHPGEQSAQHPKEQPAAHPEEHKDVQQNPRVNGKGKAGRIAEVIQKITRELWVKLRDSGGTALMGEHIVEYYCIDHTDWGLSWNAHDCTRAGGGWQGTEQGIYGVPRKITGNQMPAWLCTPSDSVFKPGIDSAFLTGRKAPGKQYAIVEAKARMFAPGTLYALLGDKKASGKASASQQSKRAKAKGPSAGKTAAPATAQKTAPEERIMQMSHKWIKSRIKEDIPLIHRNQILRRNYTRHVMLVTIYQAESHLAVLEKIIAEDLVNNVAKADKLYGTQHADHSVYETYGDEELDMAEKTYKAQGGTVKAARKSRKSGKPPVTI